MAFNHLKIPDSWNNYWTKYPDGYTVLEGLINWVSQVDLMVDEINLYTLKVDGFLEQFDSKLVSTLETILTDWENNGFLEKVILEVYGQRLETLEATIATKRDKNVLLTQSDLSTVSEAHKITPNHLNQAVKDMMTGSTPVSPNIADGSITTEKLADETVSYKKLKSAIKKDIERASIRDKKFRKVLELGANFAWFGKRVPSPFEQKNGEIVVNCSAGADYVQFVSGTGLDQFVANQSWGAVLKIGETAHVINVQSIDSALGRIYIYPKVPKTATNAILGNMMYDSQHLTKLGYQAYMQTAFKIPSRFTEKTNLLGGYLATVNTTPFVKHSASVFITMANRSNVSESNFRSLYTRTHALIAPAGNFEQDLLYQKTFSLSVPLENRKGYIELIVGGYNSANIERAEGYDFVIEFYVDGVLKETKVKTTNIVETICVPFEHANLVEVQFKLGKLNVAHQLSISSCAVWENQHDHEETVFPSFAKTSMMFDSWGEYHGGASGVEFSRLLNEQSTVSVPFTNHSKGSQTSAWGKAWFYENVAKHNPSVALFDFAINDEKSIGYGHPETINGPDGVAYNNALTKTLYKDNMWHLTEQCLNNNITPIFFGGCLGGFDTTEWYIWTLTK